MAVTTTTETVFEDAERKVVRETHRDGSTVIATTEREEWKAGSSQANEDLLRQRIENALANLELADDNWATLTAAQRSDAMKLCVRAVARLIRLHLRRLDSA